SFPAAHAGIDAALHREFQHGGGLPRKKEWKRPVFSIGISGGEDGLGWCVHLRRFLMIDAHMDHKSANRFPLIQAFALQAAQAEANPWCAVERVSDGYISQEM